MLRCFKKTKKITPTTPGLKKMHSSQRKLTLKEILAETISPKKKQINVEFDKI